MRICLICTEKLPVPPVRGGAIQTYIDGVLPVLCREHEVTVVCRRDPALPDCEAAGRLRFVRLPAGAPDTYYANVTAWLGTAGPFDAIILYNRPAFLSQVAAAAGGADLILSMHNDMFEPDRLPAAEARAVLDRVRAVLTISDYVRLRIATLYPEQAGKLRTIRSGVDTTAFRPAWLAGAEARRRVRCGLGLPVEAPVVLYVSRLTERKGSLLAVRAAAQVRASFPDVQLLVVGSSRYGSNDLDPYGQAVHAEARRLLGDHVQFVGFVPPAAVAGLYLAGDLFLCTSQWAEPLARVHYEAMAAGLPLVTTDRGGNAEVIEEGGNGLIARPHDDPGAFAACLTALLSDGALRDRLGRRGRALAEAHYTWERVGTDLLDFLAGR